MLRWGVYNIEVFNLRKKIQNEKMSFQRKTMWIDTSESIPKKVKLDVEVKPLKNFEPECSLSKLKRVEEDNEPLKLVHPSTILISGPTGCGKTYFVSELLRKNWFNPAIERFILIYGEWQEVYDKLKKDLGADIEFVHNPETYDDIYESLDPQQRNLIIFDDQMSRSKASKGILKFFTQGSHHRNLSVLYLVQNLFDQNKEHRTISLNAQYLILFRNPRDSMQVRSLGMQVVGASSKGQVNNFIRAYQDATNEPYSYLMIDARPETPTEFRLRSKIFDRYPLVYVISCSDL